MSSLPPPSAGPPPPPPGATPPAGYVGVGWTGVPRPPRVDGFAIASILCGGAGLLCMVTPVLGIVFGLMARSRIRRGAGELTGSGLAVAGLVVSALMIAVIVAFFVVGGIDG